MLGRKNRRKKGWQVELVGDQTQILKHLPGTREGERGGSNENVRGGATAREAMEKSRYVRLIERKEVRKDDPIKYFLPTGSEVPF